MRKAPKGQEGAASGRGHAPFAVPSCRMRLMLACLLTATLAPAAQQRADSWYARWGCGEVSGMFYESRSTTGEGANTRQYAIRHPRRPAPGNPWLLIAAFPGHLQDFERDLLERGWFLVYIQCPDEFGSERAMQAWESFYEEKTQEGRLIKLARKPAVLGISRGGLYALAWARRHPDKLSALYLDNGVCDARSWPGGKPLGLGQGAGSPEDWSKLRRVFGHADDAAAIAGLPRATDGLEKARDAGVLLISVHGTADTVVPYNENAAKVVAFWQAGGKQPVLFPKEGGDHHPHGLKDMTPVVEALEKAAR